MKNHGTANKQWNMCFSHEKGASVVCVGIQCTWLPSVNGVL